MEYQEIIEKYETPFYLFDIKTLSDRIDYLKLKLGKRADLCYAVKANTFIIKELINKVERLEVCSPGEFEICESLQVPTNKIVVSGVYKTPSFIEMIVNKYDDLIFTAESLTQFNLLKELSEKYQKKLKILLRLTSENQFGMESSEIEQIIKHNEEYKFLEIKGIQFFSGTQKHSLKKIEKEINNAIQFIDELKEKYNFEIKEFEYGAGLPVFYFKSDEFDEETFLTEFCVLLENIKENIKITIELGRSIAASCGTYVTRVVDKKINKVGNFAIIDGGMNHLVYYGQTMAMKHPKFDIYPRRTEDNLEDWNICGSLCTTNDILVKQLPISNLQINDVLIFKNTGAYCMCEGISLFLSRDLPKVIIKKENGEDILVRNNLKTSIINTPKYKGVDELWKD